MPFRVDELYEPVRPKPNLSSIISMIKPAIESHTTPGTKRQKASYINYRVSFCAAYEINMASFGKISKEECVEPELRIQKVREEIQFLAGFASYVLLFPRRKAQAQNSTAHA